MSKSKGLKYNVDEVKAFMRIHEMNPYHRDLMSLLMDKVEELQEKTNRLDLFEAYWDYVDKHGEDKLIDRDQWGRARV